MTRRMYALLTTQGTAMPETGICFDCLDHAPNPESEALIDAARTSPDWDGHEWWDEVTDNPEISCRSTRHAGNDLIEQLSEETALYVRAANGDPRTWQDIYRHAFEWMAARGYVTANMLNSVLITREPSGRE
jgi:hypothetical protein